MQPDSELSDLLGDLPSNLSARALADLVRILRRSANDWGLSTARRTRDRLLVRVQAIASGVAVGHERNDVRTRRRTLFLVEPPWVIAYDGDTRFVLRIVHGSRDFPALFPTSNRDG